MTFDEVWEEFEQHCTHMQPDAILAIRPSFYAGASAVLRLISRNIPRDAVTSDLLLEQLDEVAAAVQRQAVESGGGYQ